MDFVGLLALSEIGREGKLLYDWLFTANQFILEPGSLRIMTRDGPEV
jgi:hypothetical protein